MRRGAPTTRIRSWRMATGRNVALSAGLALLIGGFSCGAQAQLAGTGSTLARGLMVDWAVQFGGTVGGVSYTPAGSSTGVKAAREGTVDFGVTDTPLTAPALKQAQLRQIPLAATAVAVFVNLPETGGKPVKLTGDVLAEIYKGNIKEWNHSQIKNLNRELALPARAIVPVWRNDASGQSTVFTTYLSRQSASWRRSPGTESRLSLDTGRGVAGGAAVLAAVKATPGAIGYDAVGQVRAAGGLVNAELQNSAGRFVAPTDEAIAQALQAAPWSEESSSADLDGSGGAGSYPMATLTYALVAQTPAKGKPSAAAFLAAAVTQGDAAAAKNGFLPLPPTGKSIASRAAR